MNIKIGDKIRRMSTAKKMSKRVWQVEDINDKYITARSDENKRILIDNNLIKRWVKHE
jgi:hypothetical protein